MNNTYGDLKKDIRDFEDSVRNLSDGINNSGIAWNDAQYSSLKNRIAQIASSSKSVIQASRRCESALNRFEKIVAEE